jgi:hypothetical protein
MDGRAGAVPAAIDRSTFSPQLTVKAQCLPGRDQLGAAKML